MVAATKALTESRQRIEPQPGFQRKYLACRASILIGGGAAGCGKTWVNLIDAARHVDVANYTATLFRRTTKQIRQPGSMWDQSTRIYPLTGAEDNLTDLEWKWRSTAKVKMAHLEHASTVFDWKSSELARILFDELTEFEEEMFFYMLSRNRSTSGVRPRIRATCNPDAESWVAKLIEWWIDQAEYLQDGSRNPRFGLAIPEREGVIRFLVRAGDEMFIEGSREEAARKAGVGVEVPRSITFIPGRLDENKILERADPSYRARLMAMTRIERERLLNGNWKVKPIAGTYFKRTEVKILEVAPAASEFLMICRAWDLAATEVSDENRDPDYTAGVKIGKTMSGRYVVLDAIMVRVRSDEVRKLVRRTAEADGHLTRIALFKDPGQAGKDQAESYIRHLTGFMVTAEPATGDKETNAEPFSAQWQGGNVDVVRGAWNQLYFAMMEGFPSSKVHDDPVDGSSRAFTTINQGRPILGINW